MRLKQKICVLGSIFGLAVGLTSVHAQLRSQYTYKSHVKLDDTRSARTLAEFVMPSFYQERKTPEDQFIAAIDFAGVAEPVGFSPKDPAAKGPRSMDPRSLKAAMILAGLSAGLTNAPNQKQASARLVLVTPQASSDREKAVALRIAKMKNTKGAVIYASVRPLARLASTGKEPIVPPGTQLYAVAYFVFLPFNRAPLDDDLRSWKTFDHQGDLLTVQEAVAIEKGGACRILEIVMGNHGRRILASEEAVEFDTHPTKGMHPQIWLDEGSHEPYPFKGKHGVLISGLGGILYTLSSEDFGGIRELFLPHNADPIERNVVRPTDVRILPAQRLKTVFNAKAFLKKSFPEQDAEFAMRFNGSYGGDDSPAGPPWNMWDLFSENDRTYVTAPADKEFTFKLPISVIADRAKDLVARGNKEIETQMENVDFVIGGAHSRGSLKYDGTYPCRIERGGKAVGAIAVDFSGTWRAKLDAGGRKWWAIQTDQHFRIILVPRVVKGRLLLEPDFKVVSATAHKERNAHQSQADKLRDKFSAKVREKVENDLKTIDGNAEIAKTLNATQGLPPIVAGAVVTDDSIVVTLGLGNRDVYAEFKAHPRSLFGWFFSNQ